MAIQKAILTILKYAPNPREHVCLVTSIVHGIDSYSKNIGTCITAVTDPMIAMVIHEHFVGGIQRLRSHAKTAVAPPRPKLR
jgi:hypothetical protein